MYSKVMYMVRGLNFEGAIFMVILNETKDKKIINVPSADVNVLWRLRKQGCLSA